MKTLAIRMEDEQHARLTILARLCGVSVTDSIRVAIDTHLERLAADPSLSAKAEDLTAAIDREAAEQRAVRRIENHAGQRSQRELKEPLPHPPGGDQVERTRFLIPAHPTSARSLRKCVVELYFVVRMPGQ
jgi:predicted DNA-binding protein